MFLMEFFNRNRTCSHSRVRPDVEFAYCPDCGELVENQWFIVRCACCGVKLPGIIKNGEIIPEKKYCHNCGNHNFVIEKIDKINFIDIRYAVLIKAVVNSNIKAYTQSWTDVSAPYGKRYIPFMD